MIIKDSIAEIGLSIFSFSLFIKIADLSPWLIFIFTYDTGIDNNTASITEQRKETEIARNRYVNRSPIFTVLP